MMCFVTDDREFPVQETWTALAEGRVHAWVVGSWTPESGTAPLVVLLPGLGLPSYTRGVAHALARKGTTCVVLDVPGFGSRGRQSARPDITSIGRVAASWVLARGAGHPSWSATRPVRRPRWEPLSSCRRDVLTSPW